MVRENENRTPNQGRTPNWLCPNLASRCSLIYEFHAQAVILFESKETPIYDESVIRWIIEAEG